MRNPGPLLILLLLVAVAVAVADFATQAARVGPPSSVRQQVAPQTSLRLVWGGAGRVAMTVSAPGHVRTVLASSFPQLTVVGSGDTVTVSGPQAVVLRAERLMRAWDRDCRVEGVRDGTGHARLKVDPLDPDDVAARLAGVLPALAPYRIPGTNEVSIQGPAVDVVLAREFVRTWLAPGSSAAQ